MASTINPGREFDCLVEKLKDFGIDPIAFISARIEQLEAEKQPEPKTVRPA